MLRSLFRQFFVHYERECGRGFLHCTTGEKEEEGKKSTKLYAGWQISLY